MRFTHILSTTLILSLLTPTLAHAGPGKVRLAGMATTVTGFVLILAAVDAETSCGTSGTTVQIDGYKDQCVYTSPRTISVQDEVTTGTVTHPTMATVGWAAIGVGTLLTLLPMPKRAKKHAPSVTVSPRGVTVGKTVRW